MVRKTKKSESRFSQFSEMKKGGNKSRGKDAVKKPRVNSDPDTFCVRDGDLFTVDGGVLEGGGQILRNCVALSGLLGHSLRIKNIRANRPRGGGLKAQHLEGISLVAQLYDAKLDGAQLGSVAVEFRPQQFRSDVTAATADTKTAGSICLLIQTALPCCVFSPNGMTLTLRGGTNATQAPPIDYFMHVLLPLLQTMGINCNSRITRRGFFPKGGGEVVLRIDALAADSCIAPIRLMDRGIVQRVEVHVHFTPDQKEDDERWAQRKAQLEKFLKEKLRQCEQIEWIEEEARGSRDSACGATVVAVTSTGCRIAHSELLEKADSKKNSANVAERAVKGLIEHELDVENWNCVDRYMQVKTRAKRVWGLQLL